MRVCACVCVYVCKERGRRERKGKCGKTLTTGKFRNGLWPFSRPLFQLFFKFELVQKKEFGGKQNKILGDANIKISCINIKQETLY